LGHRADGTSGRRYYQVGQAHVSKFVTHLAVKGRALRRTRGRTVNTRTMFAGVYFSLFSC
jgi:hypothetical protein